MPSFGIPAPFLFIAASTVLLMPLMWRVKIIEADRTAHRARFAFDLLRDPTDDRRR